MLKFRLEKVLQHRTSMEILAQQELAGARQRELLLRQELAEVRAQLAACQEEFERCKGAGLTAQELLIFQNHLERQGGVQAECSARWETARQEVEVKREALVASSMDKRLLEKLKEKKSEEFQREVLARENKILDEIAIQQFYKR